MPTLAQIATKIKNLAVVKAPKRTGKLKNAIDTFNRPSGMIKESKNGDKRSFTFELDVSPPGAEYGKWWNDPTVSKTVKNGKTRNVPESINFGEKAINDPQVQKMIDDYLAQITDSVIEKFTDEIQKLDSK
jgi:hypothetical protein